MTGYKYTAEESFKKAASYCAEQERCLSQVRQKLGEWGVTEKEQAVMIESLIREGFIDEGRFAVAYATSKFHQLQWGRVKIHEGLRYFRLRDQDIEAGLNAIDEEEYLETLKKIIRKKSEVLKEPNRYLHSRKVATFAISKGFEGELVWRVVAGR
jgi:regulatory protein